MRDQDRPNRFLLGGQRRWQSKGAGGTFAAISAGNWHSCGIRTDHTVVCWGADNYGRTDAPGEMFGPTAAATMPVDP